MKESIVIDNRYVLVEQIKVGGFGIVHKGFDRQMEVPIAIKEIHPRLIGEDRFIRMFQDEALTTAKLKYDNIVRIYDLRQTDDGRFYIIMEYIEGTDLRTLIHKCKQMGLDLPAKFGAYIIGETCKALNFAHAQNNPKTGKSMNVIHRDISPSNIMITYEGEVKVIDFGIAKTRDRLSEETQVGMLKGKVPYMSPEQIHFADNIDYRSDIFSTGVVFYEALAGEKLFWAESTFELQKLVAGAKVDAKKFQNANVPVELRKIILKAIRRKPAQRYQSAREMYRDISDYLSLAPENFDLSYQLSEFMQNLFPQNDRSSSIVEVPQDIDQYAEHEKTSVVTKSSDSGQTVIDDSEIRTDDGADELSERQSKFDTVLVEHAQSREEMAGHADVQQQRPVTDEKSEHAAESEKLPSRPEYAPGQTEHRHEQLGDMPLQKEEIPTEKPATPLKTRGIVSSPADKMPDGAKEPPAVPDDEKTIIEKINNIRKDYIREIKIGAIALGALLILLVNLYVIFAWIIPALFKASSLQITSIPPGAVVEIDNERQNGVTPLKLKKLPAGSHLFTFYYDGLLPVSKQISVSEDGRNTITGIFQALLRFDSEPQGAKILFNNVDIGKVTPVDHVINADTVFQLQLIHDKFAAPLTGLTWNGVDKNPDIQNNLVWHYDIIEGAEQNIYSVQGRFSYVVKIKSIPDSAEIYINDEQESAFVTGRDSILLPEGDYKVVLRKVGFQDLELELKVDRKTEKTFFLYKSYTVSAVDAESGQALRATVISLKHSSDRELIRIKPTTPSDIFMQYRPHTIVIAHKGYLDQEMKVSPTQESLKVPMKKQPPGVVVALVDQSGNPIYSGTIQYREIPRDKILGSLQNVNTPWESWGEVNANGTLSRQDIATGKYYQFKAQASGYVSSPTSAQRISSGNERIQITMFRR